MQDVSTLRCRTFQRSQSTANTSDLLGQALCIVFQLYVFAQKCLCCSSWHTWARYWIIEIVRYIIVPLPVLYIRKAHFGASIYWAKGALIFKLACVCVSMCVCVHVHVCVHDVYYSLYSSQSVWSAWQWRVHGVPTPSARSHPVCLGWGLGEGQAGEDSQHLTVCMQHCAPRTHLVWQCSHWPGCRPVVV